MTTDMASNSCELLADSHRIALIRRHVGERDIEVEICAESGRAWLIDRAEQDVNQALIGEVLCPNFEPLRGMVRYEVPDLLAEIDRLRAALAQAKPRRARPRTACTVCGQQVVKRDDGDPAVHRPPRDRPELACEGRFNGPCVGGCPCAVHRPRPKKLRPRKGQR